MSPILLLHIGAGTVGILSGAVSMTARKGTPLHRRSGAVFGAAMITMGLTGALVATTRWLASGHAYQVGNFLIGLFTAYLAATGWVTGQRKAKEVGWRDRALTAIGIAVAGLLVAAGVATKAGAQWLQHGMGAPFFFVVGSVAVLAAIGDARLLARRGVIGPPRLRRHLWRMCTAMFIAVLSFFIGQSKVLPLWLVRNKVNVVPVLLALVFLIFWLIKMRPRKGAATGAPIASVAQMRM